MKRIGLVALISFLALAHSQAVAGDNDVIPKAEQMPFEPGEQLKYKVQYNLYFNVSVGKVTFNIREAREEKNYKTCHRIIGKGRTFGFYDRFFKVRDKYESCLNMEKARPISFSKDIQEGGYESYNQVDFYHGQGFAMSEDGQRHRITSKTQDLLSVLYYARTLDFENAKPGDSATFTTFISDSTYTVGVQYMGKTTIKTKVGKFKCLKLKPMLVVGRLFESKYDMTLWVSDDPNKVPLKIRSGISVGRIQAQLTDYENLKYPLGGKQ